MDEQTQSQALAAAEKVKIGLGVDIAGYQDAPEASAPRQATPALPVEDVNKATLRVTHDHQFVYVIFNGKPVGLTLLTARELALLLRQACNQVERGK